MIIDYSTARPPVSLLKAAGVTAVGRYLGWDGQPGFQDLGKNLTRAEQQELHAAGIAVFVSFEYDARAPLGGAAQGARDAALATRQLHDLGAPDGMTVYFAVDFDLPDYAPASTDPRAKLGPAAHYFDAIGACRPRTWKVGVYGGYWAVSRVLDAHLADMGWQTIAWSGGQWDARAVLHQLASQWQGFADVDLHVTSGDDYGQWPRPLAAPAVPPAVIGDGILVSRTMGWTGHRMKSADHGRTWTPVNP